MHMNRKNPNIFFSASVNFAKSPLDRGKEITVADIFRMDGFLSVVCKTFSFVPSIIASFWYTATFDKFFGIYKKPGPKILINLKVF